MSALSEPDDVTGNEHQQGEDAIRYGIAPLVK